MSATPSIHWMGKRVYLLSKFDEVVSNIYNIGIFWKDFFSDNSSLAKNKELICDNNHTCFVIGNGPSLKKQDLLQIQKYPVFTVNNFHKGYPEYNSNYHVCIDPVYAKDENLRNYMVNTYKKYQDTIFIFSVEMLAQLKQCDCDTNRAYFIKKDYVQCKKPLQVNMTKTMTGSSNVIPVAIECALYMGFQHIYLLGCDMNLLPNHFYDLNTSLLSKGRKAGYGLRSTSYAFFHHYALDDYATSLGREIINLSPGSLIDAYKRDNLDNIKL